MIRFSNVTKIYSEDGNGLRDISVVINDGEFVFLVGPSGAGKTTFIKLILREIRPDQGSIWFDEQEVSKLPDRMVPYYRRNIGVVFQDFRLLDRMTVFENVAFAMEAVHKSRKLIRRQVPHILNIVGISEKADCYPDELSGGEAQRVAVARAIVNDPALLIADEPTGNLDPDRSWEIMELMNKINLRGTTVVMVTHAKDIVDRMGRRVIRLDKGRVVRDDKTGLYAGKGFVGSRMREAEKTDSFREGMREHRYQQRLRLIRKKGLSAGGQKLSGLEQAISTEDDDRLDPAGKGRQKAGSEKKRKTEGGGDHSYQNSSLFR